MMLYEPGRVFQLHEYTCYSTVGGIGVLQTSPINHQFQYTLAGSSPKQVRPVINAAMCLQNVFIILELVYIHTKKIIIKYVGEIYDALLLE